MRADLIPLPSSLPRALEALGVDLPQVLRRAGLPPTLFAQAGKVRVNTDQFFALTEAMGASSVDPALGLRLGSTAPEAPDIASTAALQCADLGEALRTFGRYKRLVCPEEVTLQVADGEAAALFAWPQAHRRTPPLLIDICFAATLALARRGTGLAVKPLRLELARPPVQAQLLAAHFGCALHFDAAADRIVFDAATLALPFVTRNANLLTLLLPGLDAALAAMQRQAGEHALARQVRAALGAQLQGQRPAI